MWDPTFRSPHLTSGLGPAFRSISSAPVSQRMEPRRRPQWPHRPVSRWPHSLTRLCAGGVVRAASCGQPEPTQTGSELEGGREGQSHDGPTGTFRSPTPSHSHTHTCRRAPPQDKHHASQTHLAHTITYHTNTSHAVTRILITHTTTNTTAQHTTHTSYHTDITPYGAHHHTHDLRS